MDTTTGERPLLAQLSGILGTALLAIGLFVPSVPGRIATSPRTVDDRGFNYFAYGGQFSYMDVGQGDQMAVLAVGVIALVLVLFRRFRLLYIAGLLTLGTVALSLVAILAASVPATLAAVYMGIFPTAVAYVGGASVLSRLSASKTASFLYLVPAMAVSIAYVWMGEVPTVYSLAGGALALVGVRLVYTRGR